MLRICLVVVAALLALAAVPASAGKTRNVVLIISDGVRWQEVFGGADPVLLSDKANSWTSEKELRQKYWADDPKQRRKLLFPFLWDTVAVHGQLLGNAAANSHAQVANGLAFSYPGYNEMASGVPDPRINSNEYGPNPNVTVFEYLAKQPEFADQVEIFGTWGAFHDIFNERRSHLPVRAGATLVDTRDASPRGQLLNELYRTTTRLEGDDPFDSFLHVVLREHLQAHHPRVLFVGYGDTDTWAHIGRYDALLETAHSFDAFLGDLWQQMQAIPQYRDTTTFIISTDHGRGAAPVEWKEHGVEEKGSENIWIGIIGPDTPALGERRDSKPVKQAQIAATIAALLGKDFRGAVPAAAPPLLEALTAP
jgi:Type I phosphodiesterase / nucleotide pyrophosphatase